MTQSNSLKSKRIVVTRSASQNESFVSALRERGVNPIELPLIEFKPIETQSGAEPILSSLDSFDYVLFTSSNAIRYFFELVNKKKDSAQFQIPNSLQFICVGKKTEQTLLKYGYVSNFTPDTFTSKHLAQQIENVNGQEILYPSPRKIGSDLIESLQAKGAVVTRWPIYETCMLKVEPARLFQLHEEGFDAITFASPSTVDSFCDQVEAFEQIGSVADWMKNKNVACIGPMTSRRAEERGIPATLMPNEFTVEGLVETLITHLANLGEATAKE